MENDDQWGFLKELKELIGDYEFNETVVQGLRFFLRNPFESTILVDRDAKVQFMDRVTEEFLGLKQGEAKGKDIREFLPGSGLPDSVKTGRPIIGRILEVCGNKRIGVVYPLKKENRIVGGLGKMIFHSLEEIEKINKEVQKLKNQINNLKQKEKNEYSTRYTFDSILGKSTLIKNAVENAKKIASLQADALIMGESGTGKELFAHSIHAFADPERPFVKINSPAIPFELAESELFGYEKGAFTGALSSGKAGLFEMANNGTVYLDELSLLPLSIQAKLLRVLEEREVGRIGSTKTKKIKFRVICATNIDLKQLIKEGRFRQDLYYRIAKATIRIPPLRERREDIPVYVDHFLRKINQSFNRQPQGFSQEALDQLMLYDWPGNVRELINILEQTVVNALDADKIKREHLPVDILAHANRSEESPQIENSISIKSEIQKQERELIISALAKTAGNKREAALILKMPRSTFYLKIAQYNIVTH